jgi:hypothetical protein
LRYSENIIASFEIADVEEPSSKSGGSSCWVDVGLIVWFWAGS